MKNVFIVVLTLSFFSCDGGGHSLIDDLENQGKLPFFDGTLFIGESTGKKVSEYLTGLNTVYAYEDMKSWEDGKKLENLKKTGISALRYPEGHQVSFWDWEFPFYPPYQDIWDPTYQKSLDAEELRKLEEENKDRMLLDDYFDICRQANIEPVMGINMFQGWKFNRTQDAIENAVKLVKYCMQQEPKVTYFFLDNEAGHQPKQNNHLPVDEYIKLIPEYSKAIKAVNPEAKLVVNVINWDNVERLVRETGKYWDVFDNHWYYGSEGKWAYFNIAEWRKEVESQTQSKIVNDYKRFKIRYNLPNLKLSYLEWNAPPPDLTSDSNPANLNFAILGLIQADMLMFFANNEIHMATAWPLMWQIPGKESDIANSSYNRNMMDREDSNWLSPSATIFQAFSYIQKGEILANNNEPANGLRVLTVKREQNKGYAILVLNKSINRQILKIVLPEGVTEITEGKCFTEGTGMNNVDIKLISSEIKNKETSLAISGSSFAYILFH